MKNIAQRVEAGIIPGLPLPAPSQSLSDEEVVRRVRAGDSDLFEVIMRRYSQRLFRTLRATVADGVEAEEVMLETYVRAFAHLAEFEGRARFSTWLMRLGIHEVLTRKIAGSKPVEADDSSEPRVIFERAIEALPATLRIVYVLRDVDGLGTDETADCLGITPVNVRVRLHRARNHLRARIDLHAPADMRQLHPFPADRCDRIVAGVLRRIRSGGLQAEA